MKLPHCNQNWIRILWTREVLGVELDRIGRSQSCRGPEIDLDLVQSEKKHPETSLTSRVMSFPHIHDGDVPNLANVAASKATAQVTDDTAMLVSNLRESQ